MRCILVLVLFLASCGGSKINRYAEKKLRSISTDIDVIRQQEAKLSDIPIPISSQPIPEYCVQNVMVPHQVTLGYECTLGADELVKFFNQEMERHGWRYVSQFSGHEWLMHYEKPNRVCAISLRPIQENTHVLIFTGQKQESS